MILSPGNQNFWILAKNLEFLVPWCWRRKELMRPYRAMIARYILFSKKLRKTPALETLPQEFLDTTFLQRNDTYEASDHLPIVADFRNKEVTNSEVGSKKSQSFRLHQNYPNPFNPSTTISYTVDKPSHIELVVTNSIGQSVSTLVNSIQQSGNYTVNFDASGLSSGIYTYWLRVDGLQISKTMTLVR